MFLRQRLSWTITVALLLLLSRTADAREWPETAGWTILEGEGYCGMNLEYEGKGESELTVAKMVDGSALLLVTNSAWSTQKDQKYDLEFYIGEKVYSGGVSSGMVDGRGRRGFATKFEPSFFSAFAAGSGLKIYMGETLVDSLQLKGSAAAMVVVDRCLAGQRAVADAAERERRRFAYIPDDPFASVTAKAESTPSIERNWITADDYPPSSLRNNEEGTTKVSYTVNASGRVENCTVTASSGSSALDRATCAAITRRGRFTPRIGDDGAAVAYEREFSFTWKIPQE